MNEVVIVSAVRTPIGILNGGLSSLPAHELGAIVIKEALVRANIDSGEVSELIMGQVLTAAQGQNPARQASIGAKIPVETPAMTINQVCGSGLRSVALGFQAIRTGDSEIVLAGGQESMSLAPHAVQIRKGTKLGNSELIDTMIKDGLWDAFNDYHMGQTAENIAARWKITREEQDIFALESQQRAQNAQAKGKFAKEIIGVPVTERGKTKMFDQDEGPRPDTTLERLGQLHPAFTANGTVTAGNSSGINDGAAALVLMSRSAAVDRGIEILATIRSWGTCGVDPAVMGVGPVPAVNIALKRANWHLADIDLVEANEAFAVQSLAVIKELHLDRSKVNVNGGAIALGHPIGASGARILVTLLHEMERSDRQRGVATLCIGGGMGIALCVERG
jgi:acetyl-CoA C-acetyltransferase